MFLSLFVPVSRVRRIPNVLSVRLGRTRRSVLKDERVRVPRVPGYSLHESVFFVKARNTKRSLALFSL